MSEWKEYKLGQICDVRDGTHDSPKEVAIGKPLVTSKNIKQGKIDFESAYNISLNDFDEVNKRSKVDKFDVLFSMIGTIAQTTIVTFEPNFAIKNVGLFKTNGDQSLAKWIYYYLQCKDAKAEIDASLKGSTQQYITLGDLRNFPIKLPEIAVRNAITEILSSLDDKIDLLHRQNKTLDNIAETLFRHWFVDNNKGKNILGEYVESANTGLDAIKRAPIVEYETGTKCLRIQDVSQNKSLERWGNSKVETINFNKFQLRRDDIIMARTCSPGINLFIREDLPAVFNNGLVRIRAKNEKVHPILLNYLFKTRDFLGHIDGISGGTSVQLNMQIGDLLSYEFTFPSIEKQNEVITQFLTLDDKKHHNSKQINTLIQLRESILPKMMSGEVKIS